MLRLRHDTPKGFDIAASRNYYQRRNRERELRLMFQTIRNSLLDCYRTQADAPPPPLPVSLPQLPPNYLQYLSYLLHAPLPAAPPSPPPPALLLPALAPAALAVSVQNRESNVYFKKKGVEVSRSLLGRGSYSRVWEGRVVASGERVAVKEVKTLEASEEQCLRELRSENIIRVIDIFPHAGKSFIVLELCDCNLRQQLTTCGFELGAALNYFEQLVAGMQALQARAVVHRDLKFENLLVRAGSLKIADFGLAKFLGDELEVESRRCGTPYTMAPEVFFAQGRTGYSAKSDLWAVGVLLHEMLYQQHPFGCSTRQLQQHQRVTLPRKFGVLDRIIDRCLVFDPELRADWNEFMHLFESYKQAKEKYGMRIFDQQEQKVESPKMVEKRPFLKRKQRQGDEEEGHRQVQIMKRRIQKKPRMDDIVKDAPLFSRARYIKYEEAKVRERSPLPHKRQFVFDNSKQSQKEDEVERYLNPPHIQQGSNHFRPLRLPRKETLESPAKPLPKITHIVTFTTVILLVALMAFL